MADEQRPGDKLNVFISYSREDHGFADQLDAALKLTNFDPTLDRDGIKGAENWQEKLGALIRGADTIVFVLTPSSAVSKVCAWEVDEASRLGKRIIPVVPRTLGEADPPPQLAALNYIFFYEEPKSPGAGFGTGLTRLVAALNTDFAWLREHTRLLQRATEWEKDRPTNRLLSGDDIVEAKAWAARRPKEAPAPTALHLDFIRSSEEWEARQRSEQRRRDDEHNRQLQKERDLALEREREATALRRLAEKRALDVAGMIAATCEQGASLMFALRKEFGSGRSDALLRLVEQTRRIMEAALDAADKAKTAEIDGYESRRTADALATSPATNAFAGPLRLTEKQLQSWKMFQDTSTKIFELMQNTFAHRNATMDKIAEKWAAVLQDIQDTKVNLINRLTDLGAFLQKREELQGARKCYQAALAFVEDTDDQALRVKAEAIDKRLAALDQGPPTS